MRQISMAVLILLLSACNLNNSTGETTEAIQVETSLVYYVFSTESDAPTGSINLAGIILVPRTATSQTDEPLRQALELAMNDSQNLWASENLEITTLQFEAGHASVALTGQISGVGGLVLSAASSQLLLTIFANPLVETAVVTLNGDNIENLGISHSSQAKPADHVYTREEIQVFMANNAAQS